MVLMLECQRPSKLMRTIDASTFCNKMFVTTERSRNTVDGRKKFEGVMSRLRRHPENHLVDRIGWLRAAALGANDGIVSTASLIVGVAAAAATQNDVLIAGVAGLVAGTMSMAAGEYISVSSQSDTEQADLARERKELSENPESELDELAEIYVKRGVDRALAWQVAVELGPKHIRVNALSPGPVATRAASGIEDFDELLGRAVSLAPEHKLITIDDVGALAAFLVSDAAKAITGNIAYVDAGYHVVG
jgi:VIT family protein/enoyl-ACP reductase-like protein